jgi:hypothetical protein
MKSAKRKGIKQSEKRLLIISKCQQKSKSIKKTAATKASSKKKSRTQHHSMFRLAAQSLNLKIPFLSPPTAIVMMTTLNEYFAVVYFLKTNVGNSGVQCTHCKKWGGLRWEFREC